MHVKFSKMHGLGNDFVVINAIGQDITLSEKQIRFLADRRFGIGCDQILFVEKPRTTQVDFRYRIFNADGSEVEQCGNGARCFAKFVYDNQLTEKHEIPVETHSGKIILRIRDNGDVSVNMGIPILSPEQIPFLAESEAITYPLEVEGEHVNIAAVSMGNPHAVMVVSDVDSAPVSWLGPKLERHPSFPKRVNVGFMQVVDRENIRLRVYERGAGETLACGTGACAAVVAGIRQGLLDSEVRVALPGGELMIDWQGSGHPVMMTGPATHVYEGDIEL